MRERTSDLTSRALASVVGPRSIMSNRNLPGSQEGSSEFSRESSTFSLLRDTNTTIIGNGICQASMAESPVTLPPVQGGRFMTIHFFAPKLGHHSDSIPRPTCRNCQSTMMLCRIEPDTLEHYKYTFECPRCEHSESVVSKYQSV